MCSREDDPSAIEQPAHVAGKHCRHEGVCCICNDGDGTDPITNDWTSIPNAINQLIECIDDNYGGKNFKLSSITIKPDFHDKTCLKVAAFNAKGKPFEIAMYVPNNREPIADGY